MAEKTAFEDVIRRTYNANVRYWETVGRAASDYMDAVSKIMTDAPVSWRPGPMSWTRAQPETAHRATAPSLVLEGASGTQARTMLMISNDLSREAEASVVILPLRSADGSVSSVSIRAVPDTLTLASGARVPVTLIVDITDALRMNTDYTSAVSVPGLSENGVPIIVRRTG